MNSRTSATSDRRHAIEIAIYTGPILKLKTSTGSLRYLIRTTSVLRLSNSPKKIYSSIQKGLGRNVWNVYFIVD